MFTRTRLRSRVVAPVVVTATLFLLPGVVSAQSGPVAGCSSTTLETLVFSDTGYGAGPEATIVSGNSYFRRSRTVTFAVPAGEYDISTVGYDGFAGRADSAAQVNEQFVIEFLAPSGLVLARTASTVDLADGVEEATFAGSVGRVTLTQDADRVRARHTFADDPVVNATGSANSIQPICVGFAAVAPPTTTEAPTTTTEPPTTTTEAPPTTTEAPPPTTEAPPTTTEAPPTTTTEAPSTTTEPPTTTQPPGVTVPPTTTEAPPTTVAPTTTVAPPSSTLPPTTVPPTTVAPTTVPPTTVAPTTTVPTVVLPVVQENPDPQPVPATPDFTG